MLKESNHDPIGLPIISQSGSDGSLSPHRWANCLIAVDLSVNGSPRQFRIVAGGYLMSWGKCDDSFYPIKPTTHIWEQNDCASWSPFLPHWLVYSRPILNATLKSTHFYWIHSFWRVQFFSITGHLGLSKIRVAPGRAASLFVEPLEPWNLGTWCWVAKPAWYS